MQCVTEPSRSYSNLDSLRHDLAIMDVRETPVFRLDQMRLTVQGTVDVPGIGEYPLTEIALKDALQRGGLHQSSCENFFQENHEELDQAIVNAVNTYYRRSRYAGNEVKLITRIGEDGERIILGIPSSRYALFSHELAIEKLLPQVPSGLHLARCTRYPEFLEICLTDSLNTVKDAVGEVVEIGLTLMNSEGSRRRSLIVSCFALRKICSNGSVAKDRMFSIKYPHKGNMLNGSEEFGQKISRILQKFSVMMQALPQLGSIPVTDRLISQIKPGLADTLGVKESERIIESFDRTTGTVMNVWNKITSLPHRVSVPMKKLKLEELGFHILTNFLYHSS